MLRFLYCAIPVLAVFLVGGCFFPIPYHHHPITKAAERGDVKRVAALLRRNPSCVNETTQGGNTAIWYAIRDKNLELLKIILTAKPNLSQHLFNFSTTRQAASALHLTVWNDFPEGTKALLRAGADINEKDFAKRTPLQLARELNNKTIENILKAAGAANPPASP